MPERAHVTSVEALEDFRAALIVYLSKARPALEEVSTDLTRIRLWLEQDQRRYWENQVRYRARLLQEAEANLFSARLSPLRDASAVEQTDVLRARRALAEAEERLRKVKAWARDLANKAEPMMRPVSALESLLSHDLTRAVAWLTEAVKNLESYAELRRDVIGRSRSSETPEESGESEATAEPQESAGSGQSSEHPSSAAEAEKSPGQINAGSSEPAPRET